MNYFYSCYTDIGNFRQVNEDSLVIKTGIKNGQKVILSAVCDGVGGLSYGDEASRKAIEMISEWFDFELTQIFCSDHTDEILKYRLNQLAENMNKEIYYGNIRKQIQSGTTVSILLIWDYHFMAVHAGDSRIYEISEQIRQLTQDHSWVAQEVAAGRMTSEQARGDSRRNVIFKCLGIGAELEPDITCGNITKPTVFVICTDGLWHNVYPMEWMRFFSPDQLLGESESGQRQRYLTEQVKSRGEKDNITSIILKIY